MDIAIDKFYHIRYFEQYGESAVFFVADDWEERHSPTFHEEWEEVFSSLEALQL